MANSIIDQMKTTNQTTPKLRFPEFSGEWEEKKLLDLCNMKAGKFISASKIFEHPKDNLYPCYGGNGLRGYTETFTTTGTFPLIGRQGALCGNITLAKENFYATEHAVVAKPNSEIDVTWLFYTLVLLNLNQFATGQAQPGLSVETIEKVETFVPPDKKEQQKIADCLSSLDDLITAENKKLDALKTHKKGLMQQLFPAEGETVPRLRFPEFSGDWEERKLGEVARIQSGGTPDRKNADYWGGNIPWVTTSLIDSNTIHNVDEFITEAGLKNSSAKIFPKETILMAMYGQGKTRGKVAVLGISAATNQACAAIIVNGKIEVGFLLQNLMSRYEEIRRISNSGGQENLSAGLIENINIPLPENKLEQQKIADFLSSVDELISAQIKKIDALKIHKKGLMQQLFPVIES